MFGLGTKCKNCRKIIEEELEYCSFECEVQHMNQQIDSTLTVEEKIEVQTLVNNHNNKSETELFLEGKDFAFITGKAGTGKTTAVRKMADKNPKILLCATTGIAAINLDSSTLHSKLGFFNLRALEDSYARGFLQTKLHRIAEKYETIIVDEGSMLSAQMFDIIISGITEMIYPINLYIVGDLCQLPPITGKDEPKADYMTKANNWELFEKNTIKLQKVWRQENPDFINAINAMRESNGTKALELLKSCGVEFRTKLQDGFDGTTIIAKNKGVDEFNKKELLKLTTDLIRVSPERRGRQKSEWDSYIPHEMRFKVGAYVMILSNDIENWSYANGDCGTIEAYNKSDDSFSIRLKRNNELVVIRKITRKFLTDKEPSQNEFNSMYMPTVDHVSKDWIIGEIKYHPLRLAWASTCHKCLHEDTIVNEESKGFIPIKNLETGNKVWNGKSYVKVLKKSHVKRVAIELETFGMKKIICSQEHRFPVNNSDLDWYKEVKDLSLRDSLLSATRGLDKLKRIHNTGNEVNMIDIEVESVAYKHLFVANGILTHNSQGLSLDRVQLDITDNFFAYPSMLYVGVSRARTPEGLIIVGNEKDFIRKCVIAKEVQKWV